MELLYEQFIREKQYLLNVSPRAVEGYRWAWKAFDPALKGEDSVTKAAVLQRVTPPSLVETGGSLLQSPQYNNGTQLPALGGLPGLDRIGAGTPSSGGLVIQLDGPATTALLQGQAVQAIADTRDWSRTRQWPRPNRMRTGANSPAFS
jgi:hypothetical protein